MKRTLFLLAGAITFFSLQDVSYAQTHFSAVLNTAQEIPAANVGMATPSGTGAFRLTGDAQTGFELRFRITVTGLTGPIAAGHFHNAPAGMAGGVVRGFAADEFDGTTVKGVWRSTDSRPLTPALAEALMNGEIYANFHTAANPAGEIRGQLYPTLSFVAALNTAQEIPAPSVMGNPSGTATLTLRTGADGGAELLFNITVDGLSGALAAGHFHNAPAGMSGGVRRTITTEFVNNTASGVWRSTVQTQPLTPALLKELIAGNLYLNVHTAMNPAGEIRGQVVREQF
jgi:hypothetical protein